MTDQSDALTADEAREVCYAFLYALEQCDMQPCLPTLVHGLQAASGLAHDYAYGLTSFEPRTVISPIHADLIIGSGRTDKDLARDLDCHPMTIRNFRLSHTRISA